MRYWFLYIAILFFSCEGGPPITDKPDDLISEDEMVNIVVDMNLVEAQIAEVQLLQRVLKDSIKRYYGQLFAKYNISRSQIDESVAYYSTQPGVMDSIYSRAMAKIVGMERDLEHVELPADVLTHIPNDVMNDLLSDTNIWDMLVDEEMVYPVKHDSILRYFKKNKHLLDSAETSFRQFGVSLNFYAGSKVKLDKLIVTINKQKVD